VNLIKNSLIIKVSLLLILVLMIVIGSLGYINVQNQNEFMIDLYKSQEKLISNQNVNTLEILKEVIQLREKEIIQTNLIYFIISIFAIIILNLVILKLLVTNPLNQISNGLNSFFLVLRKKQKKIEIIKINSEDEFGDIATSLTKNISLSLELYKEIELAQEEILESNYELDETVQERTKELANALRDMKLINQSVESSIQCALLIQNSILPSLDILKHFFSDSNVLWKPKDIVGGDIYFIDEINENEVIIFFIDCTGHGVPGAFLTVLIRSLKDTLIQEYRNNNKTLDTVLGSLYRSMHSILLNQRNFDFDGLVMSYNKNNNHVKVASNNGYIFIQNDESTKIIKVSKNKRSDIENKYNFSTIEIDVNKDDKLYITTDGFIDQIGGKQGLPFGKKRFIKMIEKYKHEDIKRHNELFMEDFEKYRGKSTRLDDIMIMSLQV